MNTFKKADILIPKKEIDYKKWSIVACDQYTSEPEYWKSVEDEVGKSPSTLDIIFPEVYLSEGDKRISSINQNMKKYIDDGIFEEHKNTLIYVRRDTGSGKIRQGIVGCIDLEDYDFSKGSVSLVRATEGTVLERIPPRVKIRENAPLELPHVMILIDDDKKQIIEPLSNECDKFQKLYDFDLIQDSGHLQGFKISDSCADEILEKLDLLEKDYQIKYDCNANNKLIFAVGDGNHSLATAKTCWENLKPTLSDDEQKTHPARFALCEIVNLHDDSLEFEPIHRVVFNVDANKLINDFITKTNAQIEDNGGQYFEYVTKDERKKLYVNNPTSKLSVGTLQNFLDAYIKDNGGEVDYIHGEDVTVRLGSMDTNIGFILPAMQKNELFSTVIADGVLPRKTFSMGEAHEKRFYFECKKIK